MNWYLKVFKNYFNFKGRARRKEFWMFFLFHFLIIISLTFIGINYNQTIFDVFGIDMTLYFRGKSYDFDYGIYTSLYLILSFFPYISVSVRRFHDIGKSGLYLILYLFLSIIPNFISLIGFILLLISYSKEGNKKGEKYGVNPKTIPENNHSEKSTSSTSEIDLEIDKLKEKKKELKIKELEKKINELRNE